MALYLFIKSAISMLQPPKSNYFDDDFIEMR